ncbi:DUF1150 domain-containing protein [Maritimibacter sp. 55A14]|uniref:DUF1150 family protein n=1 Tax=Maritimibacter sp. 55A14 TaxID=2174844 RepID=UPI000D61FD8C|nr:DUF1150 family protein [Maritimibacter sp. 55A14]PWE29452.1 DUF1150 domain-containing protein [Maritimibacter sp. 55A14]
MDQKYDITPQDDRSIVYVRKVNVEDLIASEGLPDELRQQLEGRDALYAVHDADGQRLALVGDRKLAFILARQNDLSPVSVH